MYLIIYRVHTLKENISKHTNTFSELLQNKWESSVGPTWYVHPLGTWISLAFMKNPKQEKRRCDRPKQYTCIFRHLTLKMW